MKKIYIFLAAMTTMQVGFAQKTLKQAVIIAKMETQFENDGQVGNGIIMRGPGESTLTFTIKDSMTKVVTESEVVYSAVISNTSSGKVINLTESQGEKTGYYTLTQDREDLKRRMDSIQKEAANSPQMGGAFVVRQNTAGINVKEIIYDNTNETKTISGLTCKKATAVMANAEGVEEKITVWYNDEYSLPAGVNLGGRGGLNLKDLKGIPMEYVNSRKLSMAGNEMTITMTFTISEIKAEAVVEDKEFNVPKGYKVKSYQEWLKDNPTGAPVMRTIMRAG